MGTLNRIMEVVKYEAITITKLERKIGASKGVLSRAQKNNTDIQSKWISKIVENYPHFNSRWLLTGEGEMLATDNSTIQNLIPLYDCVTIGGQSLVAEMGASHVTEIIDTGDWFRDANAAMRVYGESMMPEYKPGSIIALKEVCDKRLILFGQDYVIETSEYRVIKRIQRSTNPDSILACSCNNEIWESGPLKGRLIHEPFEIPKNAILKVFIVLGSIIRKHDGIVVCN
jgi:hypothetical protein